MSSNGHELLRNRLFISGLAIVGFVLVLALLAPVLRRHQLLRNPLEQSAQGLDGDGMPKPPNKQFLLGTDNLGRDVLSRVVHGTRVSLTVGFAAMITASVIGVTVGLLAGYYGKFLDGLLMRLTEVMMTIPALLLAIAFAGLMDGKQLHLHPSNLAWHFLDVTLRPGMVSIFLIIGFVSWTGIVRVVRGQVLSLKEREFVQASRALGASDARVILRHILPNVLPTIIVLAAMSTAGTILLEAGLSYLGIGVPPPAPSWGSLIADGQPYFIAAPHIVIAPGIAIVLTVVGFNLLGQGLQDVLDPHQKGIKR
jgi:ABC-type dipeptide/oligopeptide/nickel transport system permease subunit